MSTIEIMFGSQHEDQMTMNKGEKVDAFGALFNALPAIIFVVDQDVRILDYNLAASNLMKAERKIVLKQRAGDILHCIHSRDVQKGCGRSQFCKDCIIRNSVTKAFHGNRVVRRSMKMELIHNKNSVEFYGLITTSPFYFQNRLLVLIVIENISEIVEPYRTELVETLYDMVWEIDSEGHYTYVSPQIKKILGYEPKEIVGKTPFDLMSPQEAKRISEIFGVLMKEQKPIAELENINIHKDGHPVVLEANGLPFRDADGNLIGYRGTNRDITKRKQAEEKLKKSQEHLSLLLNSAGEAIYGIDIEGNCTFVNPSCLRMLGYTNMDQVLGKNMHWLIHHSYPNGRPMPIEECRIFRAIREGRRIHVDDEVLWKADGKSLAVEYWSYPELVNGEVSGAVVSFIDIAERKLSQELTRLRLYLLEFSATHSLEELLQKTLDEVGVLVDSPIGFYHFVEKDQKTLSLQAWSTRTVKEFCKAEGKGMHYGINQAGVWVDCVREKRAVVHNDYNSLPHRKGLPQGHAVVVRELVVPIMRGGNIVAILGVGNKPVEYNEKDIEIVSYLADVAWEITERKRAEEERNKYSNDLKERMKELRCLYSISEIVRRDDISQEDILKQCPYIISQAYQFPEITACRITWGNHVYSTENFRKTAWSQNCAITVRGEQVGSIEVCYLEERNKEYEWPFLAEERNLLSSISDLLGRSAERRVAEEKIKHMATHDSLTDLPTMRLARDRLSMAINRARRFQKKLAVMFIDLDGFKDINDNFGHDAGDNLLKQLAKRLVSSTRATNTVARVGGDEFLLIATDLRSVDNAALIAEKILHLLSQPVIFNENEAAVSASIGIALYPDNGEDIDKLIKMADKAMYRIKNSGKNGYGFTNTAE